MIHNFILIGNPFFDAYLQSDLLGKLIFIGLVSLSIISWIILIHKLLVFQEAKKNSRQFWDAFQIQRLNPLGLETSKKKSPFEELYLLLKRYTLEILNKNAKFGQKNQESKNHEIKGRESASLSGADLDFVQAQLLTGVSNQAKSLEKNLFILSTIVTLAPFMGLLGTVWGILTTFSEMQNMSGGMGHSSVLSGLSLALATTVLGLLDAIPALIGYNYLKNTLRDFETDMHSYSNEMLASIELQYRKVDI